MRSATILGSLLLSLVGCGYHAAGSATHIPSNVRTMAIPVFATRTQAFRTEMAFTQAVTREMNTRSKYRIISRADGDSDATLRGTILSQTTAPLTYDSASGQTSSYLLTITAKVILIDHEGRTLYENDSLAFREQYQSTQDLSGFLQEDTAAVSRVAQDFAKTLVSDMLESF